MNTPLPVSPRRRRLWPWLLAFLLAPFLALGVAAACYLTLDRDAALLRDDLRAATDSRWKTQVQLSLGRVTLWAVRTGLAVVPKAEIAEARRALAAVKAVSVGVYRRDRATGVSSREQLLSATDQKMRERGWTRLVGVADKTENVLVYLPANSAEFREICLAVVHGRELVVVSATIDPGALVDLVAYHAAKNPSRSLAALVNRRL